MFDEHVVKVPQRRALHHFHLIFRRRQCAQRTKDFLLKAVAVLDVLFGGGTPTLFFVGAAAAGQTGQTDHLAFERAAPRLGFAPTRQIVTAD